MELRATKLGQRLAQHPYNCARLLNAGIEVSGESHRCLIPFNQLLAIRCRRGLVWGELAFELPGERVVCLHGTDWQETQQFHRHLAHRWQTWSHAMAQICGTVLQTQSQALQALAARDGWLTPTDMRSVKDDIARTLQSLPLPEVRLAAFSVCASLYHDCLTWRNEAEHLRQHHNRQWSQRLLMEPAGFFSGIQPKPDACQAYAIVSGEQNTVVRGGPGSGKTHVLLARAAWLLHHHQVEAEQILLLAGDLQGTAVMMPSLRDVPACGGLPVRTLHSLALYIVNQRARKPVVLSPLVCNRAEQQNFLLAEWRRQCGQKKSQANGWRQWLEVLFGEAPDAGDFWQDNRLQARLAPLLIHWIGLLREHGGTPAAMLAQAPSALQEPFQRRLRLLSPLLKAWKASLRQAGEQDFPALIHLARQRLERGNFVSPWRHILVDDFQNISPACAALLAALHRQNSHSTLFATGDDGQAIFRFPGPRQTLRDAFLHCCGEGECCDLDTSYRLNRRIADIATAFVQQDPHQEILPLTTRSEGERSAVTLLAQEQLESLLDRLSSYVQPEASILLLARYPYQRPALLDGAPTRWPGLDLHFMPLDACRGHQADYVIVLGLQDGREGFPAPASESVIGEVLLPVTETFRDAAERRLLYVALTRARTRVWLLYPSRQPSRFVAALRRLGVTMRRKP